MHIHNQDNSEKKMVKQEELENYLKEGWIKGRIWKRDPEKLKEMGRKTSERWKNDKEWREKQIEIRKAGFTDKRRKLISEKSKNMWKEKNLKNNASEKLKK